MCLHLLLDHLILLLVAELSLFISRAGIAPNPAGRVGVGAAKMSTMSECEQHRVVTEAVHDNGGKIAMQILHTGRYAYHPFPVSASPLKSPIGMSHF